jgi:hypothetical protein
MGPAATLIGTAPAIMVRTLGFFIGFAPALALAHHGWSDYDTSTPVSLNGKIVASSYEHPHGFVRLEAPGKTWIVVLAPPSRMERRGLPRGSLAPGAEAAVEGYPSRSKPEEMRAERISVDGKTIELR